MSASGSANGPTPTPSTTNTTIPGAEGTPGRATVPVGDLAVGDGMTRRLPILLLSSAMAVYLWLWTILSLERMLMMGRNKR